MKDSKSALEIFNEERNQLNRLVSTMVGGQLHCSLRKHIQIDDNRLQLWYVVSVLVLAVGLEIFCFIDCISIFFFCRIFLGVLRVCINSVFASFSSWECPAVGFCIWLCFVYLQQVFKCWLVHVLSIFCQNFSFKVPTLAKTINRMQMDYSFYINLNISTYCVVGMCIEAGMLTS